MINMSLIVDGTEIPTTGTINFNGINLEKIIFDGVIVWSKEAIMSRKRFLCGNWKMNKTWDESITLAQQILAAGVNTTNPETVLAPATCNLKAVANTVGTTLGVCSQFVSNAASGAYTGQVSAAMLANVGCKYAIINHSETTYFGMTPEVENGQASFYNNFNVISGQLGQCFANNLTPILCCGESLTIREKGAYKSWVEYQLRMSLNGIGSDQVKTMIISYEPIWAIGTGKIATPEQVEIMCAHIRSIIQEKYGPDVAEQIRIIYGGSMKADNAPDLLSQPNIDGGLVGGASLNATNFAALWNAFKNN